MPEGNAESEAHTPLHQQGHLNQELESTTNEHPDSKRNCRVFEVPPDSPDRKKDDREVQENGRRRRKAENVEAIQNTHGERGQADEEQIREDDPVQVNGLVPLHTFAGGNGKKMNHGRRENHSHNGEDGEDERQRPEKTVGEIPHFFSRLFAHVGSEDRNEGRGHRAFADKAAEEVRNAVGENERIGGERSTEED